MIFAVVCVVCVLSALFSERNSSKSMYISLRLHYLVSCVFCDRVLLHCSACITVKFALVRARGHLSEIKKLELEKT